MDQPNKIVMQSPAKLTPYAKNAKVHKQQDIDRLAGQIAAFGFDQPILVDTKGVIIKGHKRREAAMQLGLKKVPTLVSERDEYDNMANRLADNAVFGKEYNDDMVQFELGTLKHHNYDLNLTGYDTGDLERHLAQLGHDFAPEDTSYDGDGNITQAGNNQDVVDPDPPEELPKNPTTKIGDVWLLGDHTLVCGDCTESKTLLSLMQKKSADLLLTDPPYGVSYADKNAFMNAVDQGNRNQTAIENDHKSVEEMMAIWTAAFSNARNACSNKASYYVFSPQGGDLMMMMMTALKESLWQLKHILIWVKNNHVLGRCDYHYKHEPVLYGWKQKGTHAFHGPNNCFSTLCFDKPHRSQQHPTMKPVALCAHLINNSTVSGESVLDPFSGSGSTLLACEQLGRRCFAIELSPAYCDVIIQRWEEVSGGAAVKA